MITLFMYFSYLRWEEIQECSMPRGKKDETLLIGIQSRGGPAPPEHASTRPPHACTRGF